jgi:hypothetical protein
LRADLDKVRIELCPGSDDEYAIGGFLTFDVIAHSRHLNGIDCVCNREDPGFKRYEGASDPVGVSRSIPSLVVMGDDDRGLVKESVWLKRFGAQSRMGLPSGISLNIEASGVRNKCGGQSQQTNVVKQCRKRQMMQ